ncbi:hypothetical protein GWI33_013202 [Rhynchophorus ferrugineus]|uniref:Uncharacterized protein n=1 Tax=Rhynchophorus ferrugineus TaxID=354439 RepID=A0A834IA51_RHYFE|nr:hypothetical protein GWI33_013202 [Rhynchophorus ferrugineus]
MKDGSLPKPLLVGIGNFVTSFEIDEVLDDFGLVVASIIVDFTVDASEVVVILVVELPVGLDPTDIVLSVVVAASVVILSDVEVYMVVTSVVVSLVVVASVVVASIGVASMVVASVIIIIKFFLTIQTSFRDDQLRPTKNSIFFSSIFNNTNPVKGPNGTKKQKYELFKDAYEI